MNNFNEIKSIIRSTREFSFPFYGNVEHKTKAESAHEVVTELDFKIEKYLEEKFKEVDPSIGFVGEEFGGDRNAKKFWLIDPIDGTAHFVRGIPFCTTMVALIEGGQVVFSAIYDFVNDVLYHAERGKGAFKEKEKISVSTRPLKKAFISLETKVAKQDNFEKYLHLRLDSNLLNTISAGFEFVLVATGKIEARICNDPYGKDYDFAPGSLLVSEAGGRVANIGSDAYDYKNLNFIASNQVVYVELTKGDKAVFPILS